MSAETFRRARTPGVDGLSGPRGGEDGLSDPPGRWRKTVLPICWGRWENERVMPSLLERQVELQTLGAAVERAGTGRGSAVLVLGEAGIGKTSLVHAFLAAAAGRARVLTGACE